MSKDINFRKSILFRKFLINKQKKLYKETSKIFNTKFPRFKDNPLCSPDSISETINEFIYKNKFIKNTF